jgi:hypothetical protein
MMRGVLSEVSTSLVTIDEQQWHVSESINSVMGAFPTYESE